MHYVLILHIMEHQTKQKRIYFNFFNSIFRQTFAAQLQTALGI
jgi:hypothetical protein